MHAVSGVRESCVLGVLLLSLGAPTRAQKSGSYVASESQRAAMPARLVTLDLRDVTLREALKAVAAQGGVSLVYSSGVVPLDRRVSINVRAVSVKEALHGLLQGTDVEVRESGPGQILLVRRDGEEVRTPSDSSLVRVGLSGRITDSATGAPVLKARVVLDAGLQQTMANEAGQYFLNRVPPGVHTVSVRRIGYAPADRSVSVSDGGDVTLDIALTPVPSRLDEVVTTVTGAQRRMEVGNVIGTIDAENVVREAPVSSLTDLVNARVSGVQVLQNSGLSGSSPRVRVRGISSLSVGNDPLLVVDGVRVENSSGATGGFGQTSGRLNDLNPNDIASIEIVKGPSAATLYGTDAANGVIVVSTKRGRPGRTVWDASAETGAIEQPGRFPDNYYSWGHSIATGAAQQCLLTQAAAGSCAIDSLSTFNPLMNDATSPIGRGARRQLGLRTSGGASGFTYYVSSEYEQETGFLRMPDVDVDRVSVERGGVGIPDEQIRPNGLSKASLRGNVAAALGSKADVTLAMGLIASNVRLPGADVFQAAYFGRGYRDGRDGWSSFGGRPGEVFGVRNAEDVVHHTTSLSADWRPVDWLSTRATTGVDFSSTALDALQRRGEGPLSTRNGRRINSRTDVRLYSADAGASALFGLSRGLTSRTSVGVQYNRRALAVTTATATNLPLGSQTVTGAATISGSEQSAQSVVAGSFVEQAFGLEDRLFLTGALRADGGSSFGKDFALAVYPKASISWLPFTGRQRVRVRAAYGASGVQPGSIAALPRIVFFPVLVNGAAASGAALLAIGNPDLKPERQSELEGGVDAELLGGVVRVEATYYNRLSRDALINRPLATEIGVATRQENIGSVRNRGVEGMISAQLVDRPAARWDVTVNGSVNTNRLERIGQDVAFVGPNPAFRSRQGYPLFSRFARPILGFTDANGNGIIEASEVRVGDTLIYVGSAVPTRQLTAATSLALLNDRVRVSTQFDYRGGGLQYNQSELSRCLSFSSSCRPVNDRTASLEDQAAAVAANSASLGNTGYGYMEDGSFVRWRELAVTIALPERLAQPLRARAASITVAGRNLRLFTRYRGVDPEMNAFPGTAGVEGFNDNPAAPPARYWTARLNLGF